MIKSPSKYLSLVIPIIFLTLLLGLTRLAVSEETASASQIADQCRSAGEKEQPACFSKEISEKLNRDPSKTHAIFSGLWKLSQERKLQVDPRIFFDPVHEAGRILARKKIPLQQAFQWCGTAFKQGCMHGFLMEYIDQQYPGEIALTEMKAVCEQFADPLNRENCIHGVGHGLAAKTPKDLISLLGLCKIFSQSPFEQSACESGVFMEYSKGKTGLGDHSHAHVGARQLPCGDLPDEYRSTCYGSEASYRQYSPGHESFAETYRFCASIPSPYVLRCFLGTSERALIAHAGNAERTATLCHELSKSDLENCLTSINQIFKNFRNSRSS